MVAATELVKSKWFFRVLLIIIMIGLFFFLNYHHFLFQGPQGIHFIRQTDSLSFAAQYYYNGYDFFTPQTYNLESTNGKAACEFPIIYYATAILYGIFGEHSSYLKIITLIISWSGIIALFEISYIVLKDYFYALFIALFLFTSTVFNYYALNYLPDTQALGFVFIGWFLYLKSKSSKSKKQTITAFAIFALAGLIKVTCLISPIAILVFEAITLLLKRQKREQIHTYVFASALIGLVIVAIWNMYVIWYNDLNNSTYFTTTARPIWILSAFEIKEVWEYMSSYWYSKYFAYSSFHLILVFALIQIIFYKKIKHNLGLINLIVAFGSICYFILFFEQFRDHDYYFINFFPLAIFTLINGITVLQSLSKNKWLNISSKAVLFTLLIVGINYAKNKTEIRQSMAPDKISNTALKIKNQLSEIEKLQISSSAKVIVGPDPSKNGGLYFLNRYGWNIDHLDDINLDNISALRNQGATHLILGEWNDTTLENINQIGKITYSGDKLLIYQLY